MALFRLSAELKSPFPGVRWQPDSGKILSRTESWEALPEATQMAALALPPWDFLEVEGHRWAKHILPPTDGTETFFLIPADGYYEAIQKLQALEAEAKFLREQLHAFVQNVPLPLFVVQDAPSAQQTQITFANNLLLESLGIPLKRLYQGLTLQDLFGEATEAVWAFLDQAHRSRTPVQEIFEVPSSEGLRWWLVRAFPFQTSALQGIMVGLVDLTREKAQERELAEAYQELQTQTEELRQSQEALQSAYEALAQAKEEAETRRKELEDSLIAAQRYQRTLLFRVHTLYEAWGYERCAVVARAHTYVGGDFIVAKAKGDYLYVGVGDATGHGSSGALLAVTIQGLLHQYILQLSAPDQLHEVLEQARGDLWEILEVTPGRDLSNDGAEVALVALPLNRSGELYISTAGRSVYLLSSRGELVESQQGRRALGWSVPGQPLEPYSTEKLPYLAGDTLILFSDGLTDQLNAEGRRLGKKTFRDLLTSAHTAGPEPRDKTRHILQHWHTWKGDTEQTDDLVLIAIAL